ncbi:DNA glycosylase [Whalleya microplaca]|nr:DNA glycosylase [Whalleya microplaca]
MEWEEHNLLAKMDEQPLDSLADDYMYGFDAQDDLESKWVGVAAANGWAPAEDLTEFRRYSLFRGVEEWHQMLCCANTMKQNSPSNDPLDGQDLLTFLSKLYLPRTTASDEDIEELISESHQRNGHTAAKSQPTQLETATGVVSKKRRKRNSKGKPNVEPSVKKHKKDKESPYWSTPQAQSSNEQLSQPAVTTEGKRKSKKARRRHRRSKNSEKVSDTSSPELHMSGSNKILHETALGYLNGDNVFAPRPVQHDNQESMGGSVILRDSHLPHACHASAGKATETPRSPPLTPSKTEMISDAAELNLAASRQDDGPSEDKTIPHERKEEHPTLKPSTQIPKRKAKSPYFSSPIHSSPTKAKSPRPPRNTISCIPFPRLDAPKFGLIQEELAHDPFRLLIAVTFLIRTPGRTAIPVFHNLMTTYQTPQDLADADTHDIVAMIKHLGLGAVRAAAIQKYARLWLDNPPRADARYAVKNYPAPGDGVDVRAGEVLEPADPRQSAWEIGHMTQGRYAIDSWRIFCRDELRGVAEDWQGRGREGEFQPEWMRVRPEDKELRACLRWMWMREGWEWDPRTGEREVLSEELRRAVDEGRVAYDDTGGLKILDEEELAGDRRT